MSCINTEVKFKFIFFESDALIFFSPLNPYVVYSNEACKNKMSEERKNLPSDGTLILFDCLKVDEVFFFTYYKVHPYYFQLVLRFSK